MLKEYYVILCTVPNEEIALKISRFLVAEKLAACCNVIPAYAPSIAGKAKFAMRRNIC